MSGDAQQAMLLYSYNVGWHPPGFHFISVPMFHLLTKFQTIYKAVLS
jgi:hypothetical protein